MKKNYKTPYQERKEVRDQRIFEEWLRLSTTPGNAKTQVRDSIMAKYNIGSQATFYAVIKRASERNQY